MNFPFGRRPHFKFIFYVRLLLITCKPCACTKCKPCYSRQSPLPNKLLNTKIRHLSKQRILYIQFSVLVKSNARMFNCGDNTHRDRLFRTILALNLLSLPKVNFCHPQKFRRLPEGLPHRTLSSPQPLQKDNNPSPHVCPFTQYVNHSQVCSPAH